MSVGHALMSVGHPLMSVGHASMSVAHAPMPVGHVSMSTVAYSNACKPSVGHAPMPVVYKLICANVYVCEQTHLHTCSYVHMCIDMYIGCTCVQVYMCKHNLWTSA